MVVRPNGSNFHCFCRLWHLDSGTPFRNDSVEAGGFNHLESTIHYSIVGPNKQRCWIYPTHCYGPCREPGVGPQLTKLTDNQGQPAWMFQPNVNQSKARGPGSLGVT